MNDPGLFVAGLLVTLAVFAALGILLRAMVEDGHRERAAQTERLPHGPAPADAGEDPILDSV